MALLGSQTDRVLKEIIKKKTSLVFEICARRVETSVIFLRCREQCEFYDFNTKQIFRIWNLSKARYNEFEVDVDDIFKFPSLSSRLPIWDTMISPQIDSQLSFRRSSSSTLNQ